MTIPAAVDLSDELDDDMRDDVARAEDWLKLWASSQINGRAELRAMSYPAVAAGASMALTNFMTAEDDAANYYDRFALSQIDLIDAAMLDLAAGPHWAWWAICRRHGLGHGAVWRYERLAPGGVLPPGIYTNAVVELVPLLRRRGVI